MKMLEVNDLTTEFSTENGTVKAVRDVSFYVDKGEVLGVVGESGSGKSQTMFSIMGLLAGNGSVTNGSIKIDGEEIAPTHFDSRKKYEETMDRIRGNDMAMIFQDPMTFLNPTLRIETQLIEPIINHNPKISKKEARDKAIDLMRKVGIPSPEDRIRQYPHQFSGGMRQRIIIAIALACDPKVIIADEPTTALDVTIQAQILNLIRELQEELKMTVIYITHDLGVVANVADRVAVMYAGQIVEYGTVNDIFYDAWHPYTWALLSSLPQLGVKGEPLPTIEGTPPNLFNEIHGDAFAPRNKKALAIDFEEEPPFFEVSPTHKAKTWYLDPRAPKIEQPEAIKRLRATMEERG